MSRAQRSAAFLKFHRLVYEKQHCEKSIFDGAKLIIKALGLDAELILLNDGRYGLMGCKTPDIRVPPRPQQRLTVQAPQVPFEILQPVQRSVGTYRLRALKRTRDGRLISTVDPAEHLNPVEAVAEHPAPAAPGERPVPTATREHAAPTAPVEHLTPIGSAAEQGVEIRIAEQFGDDTVVAEEADEQTDGHDGGRETIDTPSNLRLENLNGRIRSQVHDDIAEASTSVVDAQAGLRVRTDASAAWAHIDSCVARYGPARRTAPRRVHKDAGPSHPLPENSAGAESQSLDGELSRMEAELVELGKNTMTDAFRVLDFLVSECVPESKKVSSIELATKLDISTERLLNSVRPDGTYDVYPFKLRWTDAGEPLACFLDAFGNTRASLLIEQLTRGRSPLENDHGLHSEACES